MGKAKKHELPVGALFVDGNTTARIISVLDNLAVLRPTGVDAKDMLDFTMPVSEIREKMKRVDCEIRLPTQAYMKNATVLQQPTIAFVNLKEEDQQKALFGLACCMALEELRDEGLIRITEPSINQSHALVEARIHERYRLITGTTKRGNKKRGGYEVPAGQTLMVQYNRYKSETFTPADFRTKHDNAGRPRKQFAQWVLDLMAEALEQYLDGREPHLVRSYETLKGKLQEVNAERAKTMPGHEDIKVSERKFREFAASFNSTAVKVSRKGVDEMKRMMRCGVGEISARMIGEVVHIDECELPLWVFLELTGLHKVVGEATMRQLKKEATSTATGKVWILVAVDVATGAPLAFHLARSPNADDTIELLRRLVSDKTALAQAAGCKYAPPPPIRPYMVVMDTGSGLWNNLVPKSILSLQGAFRYGRTKSPSDKAFVERFFATLGSDVMKALHGYNGQGPDKKTDYDGQDMAVMSMAQLEKILWWYFTDCLPFKTTQRKGAWGALRHVLFDQMEELYGKLPALSHREVRRAVGLKVSRTVTKMGVEAFRMPYQGNEAFRRWALANIGKSVTIYVDPHRIEEVTAVTDAGVTHYLTASLSQFRHFSLNEWIHFIEEWRAADPHTKEVAVEALYRFHQRVRQEMDTLLAFHGKEHKVIKMPDAQRIADSLAGGNLSILHGDVPGLSAPLSALGASNAMGQGVFAPGGYTGADSDHSKVGIDEDDTHNTLSDMKPAKTPRKFTGKPAGKGELK